MIYLYAPEIILKDVSDFAANPARAHMKREEKGRGRTGGEVVHAAARLVRVFPFIRICFSTDSLRANRFASLLSPDDAKVFPDSPAGVMEITCGAKRSGSS